MIKHLFASIASAAFVVSCGAAEIAEPAGTLVPEVNTAVQATGFLTENTAAPAGAADTRGDGVMRDADGRPFGYALLGQKLPAFTAPMLDGRTFESSAIDRWTVIDVWGAWCSDCVADGPYVEALTRAIDADPDLDFVSIHVPASAARASPSELFGKYGSLDAYFEAAGYRLPAVLDMDGSLRDALRISWTPTYLVVSPDGIVRGFRTDLSAGDDQPVKSFMKDIARVRGEVRDAAMRLMSPEGVASLRARTPFTLSAVEEAFPGFTVVSLADPSTGASSFEVRPAGSQTARFTVEPDWTRGYVAIVRSRDPAVRGPEGEVIGRSTLAAIPADARALCKYAEPNFLVCPDSVSPETFARVYTLAADGMPESSAVLTELRYFAPAP